MTLFLLMSCASSGTDKDSADASATADVTLSAAIDGTAIDPVEASIHEVSEDIGSEPVIANGMTGSPITVPLGAVRVWLGPPTATKTADGYRILEYDGRQWVHPIADVPLEEGGCEESGTNVVDTEGCQPTVNENGYFSGLFHCVNDTFWYDASDPEYRGGYVYTQEGEHQLEVTSGKDIVDPDSTGLDGFLSPGCSLESSGSGFTVVGDDCDQWTISSSWNGDGFTILTAFSDEAVVDYTCTVQ